MSEGFTIANFRSVAHGLQEGQFAVGERKQALGLNDLDPKYKRLLDEPVTMTLGLMGPDGRIGLTPMWFDYEGDKVLVNTASHRAKCEWIRKNPRLTILIGEPGFGLFGDVRGMIVEDQLDRCVGRIGGVEKLEEFDEFAGCDGDP